MAVSWGVERPGPEADHSPPTDSEITATYMHRVPLCLHPEADHSPPTDAKITATYMHWVPLCLHGVKPRYIMTVMAVLTRARKAMRCVSTWSCCIVVQRRATASNTQPNISMYLCAVSARVTDTKWRWCWNYWQFWLLCHFAEWTRHCSLFVVATD